MCVTLDWWPGNKYSPNPDAHYPWRHASVMNAPLDTPYLTAALAALAPIPLRVGGSLADQVCARGPFFLLYNGPRVLCMDCTVVLFSRRRILHATVV